MTNHNPQPHLPSDRPRSDQPRSDQPRSDQPRSDQPQPDGEQKSGSAAPIIIGLIALLAVVGLVAYFVMGRGDDNGGVLGGGSDESAGGGAPAPSYFTSEYVDKFFSDVDGETRLTSCDFGDEFYSDIELSDVRTDLEGPHECGGWFDVEEGQVQIRAGFDPQWPTTTDDGDEAIPGLEDWGVDDTMAGACMMGSSTEPALENFQLFTSGPCELLYPMARHVDNLVKYHNLNDRERGKDVFQDPAPEKISVADPEYSEKLGQAKDFKTSIDVPAENITGSTLTPVGLRVVEDDVLEDKLCLDADLKYGEPSKDGILVHEPHVQFRLPDGHYLDANAELEDKSFNVRPNETRRVSYCGDYFYGGWRNIEFVIEGSDMVISDPNFSYFWKARFDEQGNPAP